MYCNVQQIFYLALYDVGMLPNLEIELTMEHLNKNSHSDSWR
jgi:hypothetical protein